MEHIPVSSSTVTLVLENNFLITKLIYFNFDDLKRIGKQIGIKSGDIKKISEEIKQLRELQGGKYP